VVGSTVDNNNLIRAKFWEKLLVEILFVRFFMSIRGVLLAWEHEFRIRKKVHIHSQNSPNQNVAYDQQMISGHKKVLRDKPVLLFLLSYPSILCQQFFKHSAKLRLCNRYNCSHFGISRFEPNSYNARIQPPLFRSYSIYSHTNSPFRKTEEVCPLNSARSGSLHASARKEVGIIGLY
jgi:hypothetical protein